MLTESWQKINEGGNNNGEVCWQVILSTRVIQFVHVHCEMKKMATNFLLQNHLIKTQIKRVPFSNNCVKHSYRARAIRLWRHRLLINKMKTPLNEAAHKTKQIESNREPDPPPPTLLLPTFHPCRPSSNVTSSDGTQTPIPTTGDLLYLVFQLRWSR